MPLNYDITSSINFVLALQTSTVTNWSQKVVIIIKKCALTIFFKNVILREENIESIPVDSVSCKKSVISVRFCSSPSCSCFTAENKHTEYFHHM